MSVKLYEARRRNQEIDKELVDCFDKLMPKSLDVFIDGLQYGNHIGDKETALLAEPYITNNEGEHIGFHWTYEQVMSAVRNIVDFEKSDFCEADIFLWTNVKYGDMQHITNKEDIIINYAIAELTDDDFPFYPSNERAYRWLKQHVINEELIDKYGVR